VPRRRAGIDVFRDVDGMARRVRVLSDVTSQS